ncbi:hypothetical protein lerEdw1_001872 [Lerista edwardsae]|nr:hypothetical protein lerEdw1_001872 [Lerista edwardsae]
MRITETYLTRVVVVEQVKLFWLTAGGDAFSVKEQKDSLARQRVKDNLRKMETDEAQDMSQVSGEIIKEYEYGDDDDDPT